MVVSPTTWTILGHRRSHRKIPHHRPAYTLGGTGGIAYNRDEYEELTKKGINLSPVKEILVENRSLAGRIRDGGDARQGRQLRDHLLHRKL